MEIRKTNSEKFADYTYIWPDPGIEPETFAQQSYMLPLL